MHEESALDSSSPVLKSPETQRKIPIKMLAIASSGHAIEVFDWMIFSLFAVYLSHQFFPEGNDAAALLSTLATFAVGFLFRPLGGILFGRFADLRGRKPALVLSISLMAAGSLIIAVLPTYETVGLLAPVCLVAARMLQGISTGGEVGTAFVYFYERAPANMRGRYTSFIYISAGIATLAGSLVGLITTRYLPPDMMESWGWRIGFLIGGALGLVSLVLRRTLSETESFSELQTSTSPAESSQNSGNWKAVLRLFAISAAASLIFYAAMNSLKLYVTLPIDGTSASESDAFLGLTIGLLVFIAVQYPFGALGDKIGIERMMALAFIATSLAFVLPMLVRLTGPASLTLMFVLVLTATAMMTSVLPALLSSLLPTVGRGTGVGTWFNLGNALFGGTAPLLMATFVTWNLGPVYFAYVSVIGIIGAVAAYQSYKIKAGAEK